MENKITVNQIIEELKSGRLENPSLLSDYLVVLSANLYTAGLLETDLQISYAAEWTTRRPEFKTDKICEMSLMASEIYRDWQKAKITNKVVLECIRSLKKKLANLSAELASGQNY